jgi:hypothetical protein
MEVVEMNQIHSLLLEEVARCSPERATCVPRVSEGPTPDHGGALGPHPTGGASGLQNDHHPRAEKGSQARWIAPRQVGGQHRHLEGCVERPEQLERAKRPAGVCREGNSRENV